MRDPADDTEWIEEQIKDVMGTADPDETMRIGIEYIKKETINNLTGMTEEQQDWEDGQEE